MRRLFTLALLLTAGASCGHAACPYSWRMPPAEVARCGLFLNGVQVGSYSFETGEYRPLLAGDQWGAPCVPPAAPPGLVPPDLWAEGRTAPGPRGVVTAKLSRTGTERLEVGGEEVDAADYFGDRPEARGLPYLLVCGDDAFLAQAKALFNDGARYAPLKAAWTVGFFPLDWHTLGVGYKVPGVYFLGPQDARGKAKCFSFQAAPDLDGLDVAAASTLKRCGVGLRDPDPSFVPEQVPDLRKGDPWGPLAPALPYAPWGAAVALGGVGALYVFARRKAAATP